MSRNFNISLNEFYHCYTRGVDRRNVFLNNKDYLRFVVLLYVCNSDKPIHISNFESKSLMELFDLERGQPLVSIGAYCLMPNHIHLLLKETKEGGIAMFMLKLLTAYSMYFNKKNQRRGTLFDRPYKAQHADNDKYLKYLFSYIHLNPIKLIDPKWKENGIKDKKTKEFLDHYEWSSYLDFQETKRPQSKILNKKDFPEYFKNIKDFNQEINSWLSFSRQGEALP